MRNKHSKLIAQGFSTFMSLSALAIAIYSGTNLIHLTEEHQNQKRSLSPLIKAVSEHACSLALGQTELSEGRRLGSTVIYHASDQQVCGDRAFQQMYARCWLETFNLEDMVVEQTIIADIPLDKAFTCSNSEDIYLGLESDALYSADIGETVTLKLN
ncbi:hypothetical protein ASL83_003441 [Vibrio parahaemolyticus]|nr:hypothetical protein [Vibrio parahaemolyticus]